MRSVRTRKEEWLYINQCFLKAWPQTPGSPVLAVMFKVLEFKVYSIIFGILQENVARQSLGSHDIPKESVNFAEKVGCTFLFLTFYF